MRGCFVIASPSIFLPHCLWYPNPSNLPTPLGKKVKVKSLSHFLLFVTPWTVAYTMLFLPWAFPGKSTRVGCHFLLQRIFPTQASNPALSHQGSPEPTRKPLHLSFFFHHPSPPQVKLSSKL